MVARNGAVPRHAVHSVPDKCPDGYSHTDLYCIGIDESGVETAIVCNEQIGFGNDVRERYYDFTTFNGFEPLPDSGSVLLKGVKPSIELNAGCSQNV